MEWFKKNWLLVGILLFLALFIWAKVGENKANAKAEEANQLYLKTKADLEAYKVFADEQIAEAQKTRDLEASKREDLEREIEGINQEKSALRKALFAEKAKVKQLADDLLAMAFNNRVGQGELTLLQSGLFSLKRPGAENAVQLFIDGEYCQAELKREKEVTSLLRREIVSWENTNNAWIKKDKEKDVIIQKQGKTILDCENRYEALEKWAKKQKWTGRLEGGAGVALAVLVFRAIFGGK